MAQVLCLLQKYFRNSIFTYIALCLLLFMPGIALAQNDNNFDDPPPQTSGSSGGSRLK
ncbi:hypothetical protein IQ229_20520 [Nostoc cf. edaphicum LEGE 07299]|uniref:Uncharacterized protein n=1 Tax=Nostoc cf. edaphicum LEGE 07299 TaxID=2777974 RepID=A0ABR9U563_9NOSO|nr:hypothetical protein [Nostoc edaphicum]MBE9107222.1 hypothetical protein [Nostoc cf. edaphicum LEGE 07299]